MFVDGQHRTDYGRIVLTTDNVLHSAERVQNTPSRADGINFEVRKLARNYSLGSTH